MEVPGTMEQCIQNGMDGVAITGVMIGALTATAVICGTTVGAAIGVGAVAGSCILVVGIAFSYLGGKMKCDCASFTGYISIIATVVVPTIAVAMGVIPGVGFMLASSIMMGGLSTYWGVTYCIADQSNALPGESCLPRSCPRLGNCCCPQNNELRGERVENILDYGH